MKFEIEWDTEKDLRRDGSRRPYNQKASTIHGWVTKLRGTLVGNESTRRRGIREMQHAKAIRQWKRKRAAERKKRGHSGGGGLFSFLGLGSKKGSRSRHGSQRVVLTRGSSSNSTKKGGSSTLHFSHQTRSPHRGQGTKIAGQITQSQALVVRGKSVNRSAKDRESDRARRQQQAKRDARAMKADAARSRRR